ncbi:hypothetical protein INT45_008635 [Circinella minor]|uniref:Uncharacterized protein n=1 Tax=Circinella minor TaxID=1195481 RepID=A0A8H7S052_9FUNG|nr:hypothetical protein INT45_008635 [Circinella minor]
MDQKHNYYKDQHHDSPAQNDQQHSRYYDTYSIYNPPHQSQNLQNMQPPEKRARHSYQQTSSHYYNYCSHTNYFNSNYEYQQTSSYYDNYSSHNNYFNSNYEQQQQQQQQQQFYPYYYQSDYIDTSLNNPEQENTNNPAASSNTIATTSPPALSIDIGTLILLDKSEKSMAAISDNDSNSDNNNSFSEDEAEESEDKEDEGYAYEYEDEEMENDSDSVTSYYTASNEHIGSDEDEEDKDNENNATLLSHIHSTTEKMGWKKGKHLINLIEKYGEEPGVKQMEGALEHHHIKLPIHTKMFLDKPGT